MDAAPLFGGGGGAAPASSDVGPAAALVLASTFELVAAASLSSTAGIAAGAVSAALSGLLLALTLAVKLPTPLPATFAPNATRFLLAWWSLACLGLTFTGPFTTLGNGHLSTWGALFASVAAALPYSGHLARAVDRFVRLAKGDFGLLLLLCIGSAVVALQAFCSYVHSRSGVDAWALAVGLVSAAGCGGLLSQPGLAAQQARIVSLATAGWWTQGLVITFLPHDFTRTVNGFLAVWTCILLSLVLLNSTAGGAGGGGGGAGGGGLAPGQPRGDLAHTPYSLAPTADNATGGGLPSFGAVPGGYRRNDDERARLQPQAHPMRRSAEESTVCVLSASAWRLTLGARADGRVLCRRGGVSSEERCFGGAATPHARAGAMGGRPGRERRRPQGGRRPATLSHPAVCRVLTCGTRRVWPGRHHGDRNRGLGFCARRRSEQKQEYAARRHTSSRGLLPRRRLPTPPAPGTARWPLQRRTRERARPELRRAATRACCEHGRRGAREHTHRAGFTRGRAAHNTRCGSPRAQTLPSVLVTFGDAKHRSAHSSRNVHGSARARATAEGRTRQCASPQALTVEPMGCAKSPRTPRGCAGAPRHPGRSRRGFERQRL